jgi:hypothetical protein
LLARVYRRNGATPKISHAINWKQHHQSLNKLELNMMGNKRSGRQEIRIEERSLVIQSSAGCPSENDTKELNKLLKAEWRIESVTPMGGGGACMYFSALVIISRQVSDDPKDGN